VGAAESLIRARLRERRQAPLADLVGPLMAMILLPYRGAVAARRELSRPVPETALAMAAPRPAVRNPLGGLSFRFTYRTLRVLDAIDQQPEASNCEVAMAAGVKDQGQISKLLARLKRLELITEGGTAHARGLTNAWRLTPRGEDVHRTMTSQLAHARASANGDGNAARRTQGAGGRGGERRL
jgi:hypothetical protein